MDYPRLKRFLSAAIFCLYGTIGCIQAASAQTTNQPETSNDQNNAKGVPVFPVPTNADGAELLKYEGITFTPDTSPMPDIAATVRSARKTNDPSSMFITHMMYRDHIADIAYYNEGKKQNAELSPTAQHREMIRWRDEAAEASYELAILATSPSVQYEISPLFAKDDEFKKGFNWLQKAAAHGYGNAEFILGLVYFNGVGTKKDKAKGYELLVRAAAHGVINACYAVAMIHEMGLNGPKDTVKSMYWLQKAAHFGNKDAIFILAMKYADGIDVPKDEKKSEELEKLDPKYHVWTRLHRTERGNFYHKYCVYKNDESSIGWSTKESGECESYIAYHNPDDIDEDREYTVAEAAASSLDYKIDYRLAALWLKKNASIEHENIYMLRSQAHHLIGCRGELDKNKFKDILLYPDEEDDEATDYDTSTQTFKLAIIALNDYKTKPAAMLEWLNTQADAGNKDVLFTLGHLYEQNATRANNNNSLHSEIYETFYNSSYLYSPLYKKLKLKPDLAKALEYYEKAHADADARRVAIALGDEARQKKDTDKANAWYDKAIQIGEKAYQYHVQNHSDDRIVRVWARRTANTAVIKGDDSKAVEWYQRAIDRLPEANNDGKINLVWFTSALRLAQLYYSGSSAVQNKDKAAALLKIIIQQIGSHRKLIGSDSSVFDFQSIPNEIGYSDCTLYDSSLFKEEFNAILCLAEIYDQGTRTVTPNPTAALRLRQMAAELGLAFPDYQNQVSFKTIKKTIESLPKIDLQSAVEKQIIAEKDKDPYDFYIFNKLIYECEKEFRRNGYHDYGEYESAPDLKCSRILPDYQESIQKAITAITALSLASGSKHPDEIRNTFYYLAVYKGNDKQYRQKLQEDSAVYNKLVNYHYSTVRQYFEFDKDSETQLFYIWYLRQIPYAAAEKFKTLNAPKSWKEYMNEAQNLVQQNEQLRTAFGYDPAVPVQKFVAPN